MPDISSLQIRPARPSDAPELLNVVLDAFAEYDGVLEPRSGAHLETLETVRRRLDIGESVIAELHGHIAGVAFCERHADGFVYFGRLAVRPEFRRRGIARAIVHAVERRARESGAPGVRLGVRLALPRLVEWYERLGYRITRVLTHEGCPAPTYVYMEKTFDHPHGR